jgi:hypothetical protein
MPMISNSPTTPPTTPPTIGPVLLFELEAALPLEPAGRLEEDATDEDSLGEDSLEKDLVEDGVVVTAGVVVAEVLSDVVLGVWEVWLDVEAIIFFNTRNLLIEVEGRITGWCSRNYSVARVACYAAVALIQ